MGAVPDFTIEPMAFSTMFDSPPFLLPGVVLALRSTPPRARYLSYQPSSAMSAWATSGLAARAVSCATPSRTSVFSENMTVAPARTSRSLANPRAGLAVTPEKASLPPHCMPTTKAEAGQVSRLRLSRTCRCCSAVHMIELIMASKPMFDGSCKLQFLTTKTNDHRAAAEIRIEADVSECSNWDLGVWRLDRYATAVNVLKADHVVDIGVLGEQLVADPAHRVLDYSRDALDGCGYGEQVASSHRPIGIAVAFKCVALEGRRERCVLGRNR